MDLDVVPPSMSPVMVSNMGRGREIILDMPFMDQRPHPERCGMQKNGYNMDTADVHCVMPPRQWMAEALAQGLIRAGFRVQRPSQNMNPSALIIQGTVLQFFVEPTMGGFTVEPEADISVRLVARSASGLHAERVFYVKGIETSVLATEENFQQATTTATRDITYEMVHAIATLMDRYPQVGTPVALEASR